MMMPWLLKNEGYPPAVVVAVLLHAILLYVIFERELSPADFIKVEPAPMLVATVMENPQKLRKIENVERQRQEQQRADQQRRREEQQRVERERVQREAAQQEAAERQRVADQQRAREQAEQRQREEATRAEQQRQQQQREQAQREQAQREQAAREQAALQEAERQRQAALQQTQQALTEEQQLVAQYVAIIHDLITQNWQLPPGARNGMQALVQLRVTPSGEIISSNILQSSGDVLFDRSVLQAVERVGNFPELRQVPTAVFERHFRSFNLLFQPEDLLR